MSSNQTIESSQLNGVEHFVCFVEIPSLQEIASHQVALAIRYQDQSRRFFNTNLVTYGNFHDREFHKYDSELESLKTPSAIEKIIKNSVEKIEEELHHWLNYFNHVLYGLSRHPYKVNPVDINWCVWLPNGEIDYLKTGMKMLKSEKLSKLQKFLIMCEYCMEDEIKKVSLDKFPIDYIANTRYNDDGILFYWIHFLKNTLNQLPLENIYASPEAAMARTFRRYSRFPVEYFWYRIGAEDQLVVVGEWIATRCSTHFECATLERLISAMSLAQQQRLLANKSVEMLVNFSLYSSSTQCALWTWENCKEVILDEQFAEIIELILTGCSYEELLCPALSEIWETAYDHQRNFVLQTKSNSIVDICLSGYNTCGSALEFVIRFLQQMSLEDRKKIIFEQAPTVKHQPFNLSSLYEIMNVCLPQPSDKLKFIKSVIDTAGMKEHFFKLLHAADFKKVDALLEDYFGSDIEGARAFKIKLLESLLKEICGIDFICDIDEWKRLAPYIDEIFSNNPAQALKEKQRLIKLAMLSKQHRNLFDFRCNVQGTMKIVELLFANDDLNNIKHAFACSFGESLKTRSYWENEEILDETYFQRIISWCLGADEEAILGFKKRVSQDTIFDRIFFRINKLYREREINDDNLEVLLDHLNKYLKWYLASDDQVRMFKLSRLSASLKIFKSVSKKRDVHFLEVLLKWFFGGDNEMMGKFRSENFRF